MRGRRLVWRGQEKPGSRICSVPDCIVELVLKRAAALVPARQSCPKCKAAYWMRVRLRGTGDRWHCQKCGHVTVYGRSKVADKKPERMPGQQEREKLANLAGVQRMLARWELLPRPRH